MKDKKNPVLVWDSSGTMTNSFPERFLICADAYLTVHPDTEMQITPKNKVATASDYVANPDAYAGLYKRFEKLNPFVKKGIDGYAILEAIRQEADVRITTNEEFVSFQKGLDKGVQEEFYRAFKKIRKNMKESDTEAWYGLQPCYPGIPDAVRKIEIMQLFGKQYVLTAKDSEIVAAIVASYGLSDVIPRPQVIDAPEGKSKALAQLASEKGIQVYHVFFAEDSMPNLIPCHEQGHPTVLAGWGYNNDAQRAEAVKMGIPVARDAGHLVEILKSMVVKE